MVKDVLEMMAICLWLIFMLNETWESNIWTITEEKWRKFRNDEADEVTAYTKIWCLYIKSLWVFNFLLAFTKTHRPRNRNKKIHVWLYLCPPTLVSNEFYPRSLSLKFPGHAANTTANSMIEKLSQEIPAVPQPVAMDNYSPVPRPGQWTKSNSKCPWRGGLADSV